MKLKKLFKKIPNIQIKGVKSVEISGICSHSKRVSPGNLFIVKKGALHDGHQYIEEAIRGGAVAILTDLYDPFFPKLTQLIHPNVQEVEGLLAHTFYEEPSKELLTLGITGTNGKTTTSYLIKHLLDGLGKRTGLIGSIEYLTGHHRYQATHTTPDVISNHKYLKEMLLGKCKAAVLEVTSHGIDQGRVAGIDFDVALFTNLTQDHLDYHQSMETYALTKRKLFESLSADKCAIINNDDEKAPFFLEGIGCQVLTYGIKSEADVQAKNIYFSPEGTHCTFVYKGEEVPFSWGLIGQFNIYNCLAAVALALHLGYSLEKSAAIISTFSPVPGRLQSVPNQSKLPIFVDFSHTPDALKNALECLSAIKENQLITVFGCGGNRDRSKRPKMAKVAEQLSDHVIVTSDNPRKEDPEMICRDILTGFSPTASYSVELDRRKAIAQAIERAEPNDLILIAGKGHETYQIFSHHTVEFNDFLIAQELCEKLYV